MKLPDISHFTNGLDLTKINPIKDGQIIQMSGIHWTTEMIERLKKYDVDFLNTDIGKYLKSFGYNIHISADKYGIMDISVNHDSNTHSTIYRSVLYDHLIISHSEYDLEKFFNSINDTSDKSKLVALVEAFNRKQKIDNILER